jgi:tetratricopeptide (TPR) repeat protein
MNGALSKLLEVVTRSPADAQGWYAFGVRALELGEISDGTQAVLRAVQLAPLEIDRVLGASLALLAAGKIVEAEQTVRAASARAPERLDLQVALARILLGSGRASEAIGILGRVLRADPRSIDAHSLAATAYDEMGMLIDAADHLALVLAADARNLDATKRLGDVLERLGDDRGFVRSLQRLATLSGRDDFAVLTTLGITLSGLGRHKEAIEVLKDVAARRRNVGSAYADLGLAQLGAEHVEDALATIGTALKLDAGSAQAHCALGLCQQKLGRLQEAAEAFAASERLAPDLAVGPLNLGLTLESLADLTGARRALLRAFAIDPNDPDVQGALERVFGASAGATKAGSPSAGDRTGEMAAPGTAIAGNLATTVFLDLLEFLRLQRRTGTLALSSSRGAGEVRLYQGQISSAATSSSKRFDQALIEVKAISKSNLEAFIARTGVRDRESVESLGTLLIRHGAVEPRPIAQLLSRRIHTALTEIVSWPEGPFSFHASEASIEPAIFFNLQDVITELLRAGTDRKQGGQRPAR